MTDGKVDLDDLVCAQLANGWRSPDSDAPMAVSELINAVYASGGRSRFAAGFKQAKEQMLAVAGRMWMEGRDSEAMLLRAAINSLTPQE